MISWWVAAVGIAVTLVFGFLWVRDVVTGGEQGLVPTWAWTVGAGVDYLVSERLAVRAEYLYSQSFSSEHTHLDTVTCCGQIRSNDTLRVGLAYFFH